MMELLTNLIKDEEGQGMVEYGLIIALVAVVLIFAFDPMTEAIASIFERIGAALDGAGN